MEYLAKVRDGSKKTIGFGYWLCSAIAVNQDTDKIIPLANRLYSSAAPDFKSENDHILDVTSNILEATHNKSIVVIDKGGDRRKLLVPWTQNKEMNYIVRQRGDRHLYYRGGLHLCRDLAYDCTIKFSEVVTKIRDGKSKIYHLRFGYVPV